MIVHIDTDQSENSEFGLGIGETMFWTAWFFIYVSCSPYPTTDANTINPQLNCSDKNYSNNKKGCQNFIKALELDVRSEGSDINPRNVKCQLWKYPWRLLLGPFLLHWGQILFVVDGQQAGHSFLWHLTAPLVKPNKIKSYRVSSQSIF